MAGIYIHIPFCRKACHYCNFHFSTSLRYRGELVEALIREIGLQSGYLSGETIETVYFGGGTPSLLSQKELEGILDEISRHFTLSRDAEITLEANPDDLSVEKLQQLAESPVNRLSIGIQSFSEKDLVYMNRSHNAQEAHRCIEEALKAGFSNMTIDLIYGSPTTPDDQWKQNLSVVFDYGVPHVSCYCLTVEEGTALNHFVKKGKSPPVDEQQAARQFEIMTAKMREAGYVQYEISNFAHPGFFSRHNSSYWKGKAYLGIGPSAHSFNGHSRQWNVAHNIQYIKSISEGRIPFELEILTPDQKYNEYVMTSLRTIWGCERQWLKQMGEYYEAFFVDNIRPFLEGGKVIEKEGRFCLTEKGKLFTDRIAMEVFCS